MRAYVHIDHAVFQEAVGIGVTTGWVDAKIKNYGTTPARDFVFLSQSKIERKADDDIVLKLSDDAFLRTGATIPPGATFSLKLPVAQRSLGQGDWEYLTSQGFAAYIWGRMNYTDAFNRERFTNFQMVCVFGEFTSFTFCEKGNDAT